MNIFTLLEITFSSITEKVDYRFVINMSRFSMQQT